MSGMTDWFRWKALGTILGTDFTGLTGVSLNMLTVLPVTELSDGTTDETEWSLSGVSIAAAPTTPNLSLRENATDGIELFNTGQVLWNSATTSALAGTTTCVGVGVYDDTTGFLAAYDDFAVPIIVQPGEAISFETDTINIRMRSDL